MIYVYHVPSKDCFADCSFRKDSTLVDESQRSVRVGPAAERSVRVGPGRVGATDQDPWP